MLCLLLASVVLLASHQQGNALTPLPGVKEYEVVYPQKLYARHRRDTGAKYPDEIQYGLKLQGKDTVLHLKKNDVEHQGPVDIKLYAHLLFAQWPRSNHQSSDCGPLYYHGYIKSETDSEASISICNGVRGYFKTKGQRYLIEPLSVQEGEGHAVYKYESLENTPKTCGVTNTSYDVGIKTSRSAISTRTQEFLKSKKYIELYMVADNSIFNKYNRNKDMVQSRIFEVVNYVNLVYKAINTFVALTGIDIWSDKDQFDVNSSAGVNLDRFSAWRNEVLLKKKYNDNAQFLTNTDFDGPTVGLAFVGTMCSSDHSTGVIQDHTSVAISVGATVAHEMGHNLGMNHDTNTCTCDEDSCIMAASLSYVTPKLFSTCSHQQFQDYILAKMPVCMRNKPSFRSVISPPVCGNGFIESGEQCDCGLPEECQNPCCDAATCKLAPNAKCADGECCESCQIKKAGLVCRKRKDDCDIPENCDGASATCPVDKFRVNGYPCKNGQGYCNQGTCPILESQCTDLWGQAAKVGTEQCFKANRRGVYWGYCEFTENSYVACNAEDVQCGKLYCSGGLDTPLSVYASIIKLTNCKTLVPVSGAVTDNLGMVLNGTTCGDGKVCNLGHCVDLVKAYPRAVNCSSKCKGHAVCDHENMCQCEEGWAPPDCDVTSGTNVIIIIVVVVLLVVTIVIVIGLLWYRGTFKRKDKSSQLNTVSGVTNEAYQAKQKNPSVIVHTPELPTRSLLTTPSPPTPPAQANKPRISFMSSADGRYQQTKVGYSSPQYVVASPSPEPARNNRAMPKKPSAAPPPVPVSKPGNYGVMPKPPPIPTGKPVLPSAPPKALKPPTNRLNV